MNTCKKTLSIFFATVGLCTMGYAVEETKNGSVNRLWYDPEQVRVFGEGAIA
ncbi:MAG: hypothetical protein ABJK89_01965 [Paracoccaceae bacterium]